MEGIEIYLNDQDNLNMAHIPNNVKDSFCFDLLMNDVDLAIENFGTFLLAIIFLIFGIPANCMILFVSYFDAKKTSAQFFMNNIAIADIIWLLCRILSINSRANGGIWTHGLYMCYLIESVDLFVSVMSMMMIMMMAIDRYTAITMNSCCSLRPSKGRPWVPVILLWMVAIILAIPNAKMTKLIDGGEGLALCVTEWPNPSQDDIPIELQGQCRIIDVAPDEDYVSYDYSSDDSSVQYSANETNLYEDYFAVLRNASWDEDRCKVWLNYSQQLLTQSYSTTTTAKMVTNSNSTMDYSANHNHSDNVQCGCPSGSLRQYYHIVLFIVVFVLPLIVLVYCYATIYHEINIVQKAVREHGQSTLQRDRKTRALIYILLLVAGFAICWGPWYVFQVIHAHGFQIHDEICRGLNESVKVCAWFHACLNPIVYGFIGSGFRKRFSKASQNFSRISKKSLESTKMSFTDRSGQPKTRLKGLHRMHSEPLLLSPAISSAGRMTAITPRINGLKRMESEPILLSSDGTRLGPRKMINRKKDTVVVLIDRSPILPRIKTNIMQKHIRENL